MNDQIAGKVTPIPDRFQCPLSKSLMADPVVATDGHTYEREWIAKQVLVYENLISPMTNEKKAESLLLPFFIPNLDLKSEIKEFVTKHKEHKEEYDALEAQAEKWKINKKLDLPKKIVISGNDNNEERLISIFDKKGGDFCKIINRCVNTGLRFSFWIWLSDAYRKDAYKTEAFITAIDTDRTLQAFFAYNKAFQKLSGECDLNTLLSTGPSKLSRWVPIIHTIYNRNKQARFKIDINSLKFSLDDIDRWQKNEEDLLSDIIAYSTNVKLMLDNGNFSTQKSNNLSLSSVERLKELKGFSHEFRKKIFNTHWMNFRQLNDKDRAAIPFYKWVVLWNEEKKFTAKNKIFDLILKNSQGFHKLVENIREEWFRYKYEALPDNTNMGYEDNESDTTNNSNKASKNEESEHQQAIITPQLLNEIFDQTVSIHDLWDFYKVVSSEEYNKLFLNDEKVDVIHNWLIKGQITPKQLIDMLSDQTYKIYYGNYITAYGTEELALRLLHYQGHILKKPGRRDEFYAKKTKQLFEDGLEKMGVLPKKIQVDVQVTETQLCLTCENVIHFEAMKTLLFLKDKPMIDDDQKNIPPIQKALSFDKNNQHLSIARAEADECLKYMRETIENTDKNICKGILQEAEAVKNTPNELESEQPGQPKQQELGEEKNNKGMKTSMSSSESNILTNSTEKQLTEQQSPSKLDFIKCFVKSHATSFSLISMVSGLGLYIYELTLSDTSISLVMLGVSLLLLGIVIVNYGNHSNESNDEINYKSSHNTQRL